MAESGRPLCFGDKTMETNLDSLLTEPIYRSKCTSAAPASFDSKLPADIRVAAPRSWQIFLVPAMSRHASIAAVVERIGQATSDLARLELILFT
jgi:hypothetical protein